MMTPRVAQAGLHFGADDLDGTVVTEEIYHRAGSTSPQMISVRQMIALIEEAGGGPVERDTLFKPIRAALRRPALDPRALPPSPAGPLVARGNAAGGSETEEEDGPRM